jgi:hypothetical protein
MKKFNLAIVLLVLGYLIWSHIPSTAPAVTVNDSQIMVGADSGDHAVFNASSWTDLHVTCVSYGYNSFGIGGQISRQLGGRAMISFMEQSAYDQVGAEHSRSGRSMEDCLSDSDAAGAVHHLALIPRDSDTMEKMHDVRLENGAHFHISGNFLTLQSAVLDGGSLHDTPGDVGYFLVDNVERE